MNLKSHNNIIYMALFFSFLAGLLLVSSSPGPDFEKYTDWARAFITGNIFEIPSKVVSPMGVPVSQWSHGPGLVFAMSKLLLLNLLNYRHAALIGGWMAALLFWGAMSKIIHRVADGNFPLILFGLGLTFIGTHAGYYSLEHASESLSLPLIAILVLQFVKPTRHVILHTLIIGVTSGLLIMIRAQLVIYALPVLAIGIFRLLWGIDDTRLRTSENTFGGMLLRSNRPSDPREELQTVSNSDRERSGLGIKVLGLLLLLVPVIIAMLQIALVNRWMTGSLIESPYNFAYGAFKSVDFAHPELLAVLAHPWHGLLTYHPLYAVCFVALLVLFFRSNTFKQRILYGGIAIIVLSHLYIHASWYAWWLGTGTFGMRGMSVSAVVLIPVLVHIISKANSVSGGRISSAFSKRAVWVIISILACLWSYLLLLQGETQFFTYGDLLVAQWNQLVRFMRPIPLATLLFSICISWAFLRIPISLNKNLKPNITGQTVRVNASVLNNPIGIIAVSLIILVINYLFFRMISNPYFSTFVKLARLLAATLFSLISIYMVNFLFDKVFKKIKIIQVRLIELTVGGGLVVVFVIGLAFFTNLAIKTESRITGNQRHDREFLYTAKFELEQTLKTYHEYLLVRGFAEKKAGLRKFLESHNVVVDDPPGLLEEN